MLFSCLEGTTRAAKNEEIGARTEGKWLRVGAHDRQGLVGSTRHFSQEHQEAGRTNWTGLMQSIISANSTSSMVSGHTKARRGGGIEQMCQDGKGELGAHNDDGANSPMAVIDPRTLPRLRGIRRRPPP